MATYKTILKISELGLKGDKKSLLSLLQKTAIEEVNNGKHSLYNGLIKLLNNYSSGSGNSLENSSLDSIEINKNYDYLPEAIWISPKIEKRLANFIEFHRDKESFDSKSIGHLNKILLHGCPGTGKTTLGFYIAKSLNKTIRYVRISDIVSSRFGETIKNFSNLFDNSTEEVIFIDEFDAFAKNREDNNDVGELKRIVNAIIQILDFQATNKIVIVSTNLASCIDPAILRRFAFKLLVDVLDSDEAESFFEFLIKEETKIEVSLNKSDTKFVVSLLEIKTIDSIRVIFEKALLTAMLKGKNKIGLKTFLETLILEGYLDKKQIRSIQEKSPKKLLKIKALLEQNFTQKEACEMLGMHRNSYKNYF